jgi:hypothetical protein
MASRLEWWGGICTSAVFSHILRYLEPNAAAKVTGDQQPDRDLGSPQSFTENYSRWCIYTQMLTNTEQLNGLRLENHPKESNIMLGFLLLQLTKRKDTQKFQVATGTPSMASERQVYIFHQQVLWYCASLRP